MKKTLLETKTIENLLKSFAGECQARGRYTMFQKKASNDGFEQIANIFRETADNEVVHSEIFYKHIIRYIGSEKIHNIGIHASYPVVLGGTFENLKAAAEGEYEEATILYPTFAKVAEEEGFPEIAFSFNSIAGVEKVHNERYLDLAESVAHNKVFKKDTNVIWKCLKCGYHHFGEEALKACPVCGYPKSYFEVYRKNY